METETIDRLYLELSQITTATTAKELALTARAEAAEARVALLRKALAGLSKYSGHDGFYVEPCEWFSVEDILAATAPEGNGNA